MLRQQRKVSALMLYTCAPMSLISQSGLIAILGIVVFGQPKPERYRFGYVVEGCGAISIAEYIVLTTRTTRCDKLPTGTRLTITVECCVTVPELPRNFEISSQHSDVGVSRCVETHGHNAVEACVAPASGHLRLDKSDGNGAAGEYDFTFADGDHASGQFEVKTCKRKKQNLDKPCE
jgi:hypothetical protein